MNPTPEARKKIEAFFRTTHVYYHEQTNVSKITGASLSDLNTWRKRGQMWGDQWEKSGRVRYTGFGLINIGIMAELTAYFSVAEVVEFFEKYHSYFAHISEIPNWEHQVMRFRRHNGEWLIGTFDNMQDAQKGSDYRPTLIVPVGAMIARWAVSATEALDLIGED